MQDGGRLRVANVYTWGVESDQEEVLDARNLTNGIADRSRARANGLSPQAVRRNEMQMRDGTVDEQEVGSTFRTGRVVVHSPPAPLLPLNRSNNLPVTIKSLSFSLTP